MMAGTKQKLCDTEKLNIKIDNHDIEAVNSQKLLGIHIDEKFELDKAYEHCELIISPIESNGL